MESSTASNAKCKKLSSAKLKSCKTKKSTPKPKIINDSPTIEKVKLEGIHVNKLASKIDLLKPESTQVNKQPPTIEQVKPEGTQVNKQPPTIEQVKPEGIQVNQQPSTIVEVKPEVHQVSNFVVKEGGDDVEFRTMEEISNLDNESQIQQDLSEPCNRPIYMTKREKSCLEEIKNLISKIRMPSDERQMYLFNRDIDKFTTNVSLSQLEVSPKELQEAATILEESPSNIIVTDLNALAVYLNELKLLIAKREIAWAAATENSYAQKIEIFSLKNKVDHLRSICTKRQGELEEKDKILAEKDAEIGKLRKSVERLRYEVLQLSKDKDDERVRTVICTHGKVLGEDVSKGQTSDARVGLLGHDKRNYSPAALLANALHKARTGGSYVNF